MKTRIQKWGNSLGLRIPKPFAEEIGLQDETVVELRLRNGRLVIEPASLPPISRSRLLRRVRRSNLHAEVDTGSPRGREAW